MTDVTRAGRERIETLFHEARVLPAPRRAEFLDRVCGGDTQLRREIENLLTPVDTATPRYVFGNAVLDERSLELTVNGQRVELERKPLDVLMFLLRHAGEVVTKDELADSVWTRRVLDDQVIARAVGKLRQALGDNEQRVIKTVHGYGYRLVAEVKVERGAASVPAHFDFKPGEHPDQRPNWSLVERLGTGGHGEAWLVRHDKTHELRVYKFALNDASLPSLKREITVSRLLQHAPGGRGSDFVRVLEWNLNQRPYFIECEYAVSGSLMKWAASQGGLDKVPLDTRLNIAVQIAELLAVAHSLDILHKDLKPSNILIEPDPNGPPRVKLCDFGSSRVLDPKRLEALGITRMGFTQTVDSATTSGTAIYFAPEVLAGTPATRQTDIYALGVILYQLVVGDFKRTLAPGWELDVADVLLREDIALTAAGRPQRRLTEAAELARRIRTLDQRRAELAAASAAAAAPAAVAALTPAVPLRRGVMGLLILAILLVGGWGLRHVNWAEPSQPSSIAVLPFVSTPAEDEYFGDGMAEELISALARVEGIRVISRTSAFAFKGKPQDVREIGKALNVETVLEGNVRRGKDGLRVAVRLINVADGFPLWSESYERGAKGVFAIQDEISRAIVRELRVELVTPPGVQLIRQGTENLAAYEAYLRGRFDTTYLTTENNGRAIALLEEAVSLDPAFARAYAALAIAYANRVYYIAPGDEAALNRGLGASEKALALDPELSEAHLARARLFWMPTNRFDEEVTLKELLQALELNPKSSEAWSMLSALYLHAGLWSERERAQQRAVELDPHDFTARFQPAATPTWLGRYAEGLDRMERIPKEGNPQLWYHQIVWGLVGLDRIEEASARVAEFLRTYPDKGKLLTSWQAILDAKAGRKEEVELAVKAMSSVDRRFGHFHHTSYNVAAAHALLNRRVEALEWLDWTVKNGLPCYSLLERDPNLNNLRDEPRFRELLELSRRRAEHLRSLGFPQQAESVPG